MIKTPNQKHKFCYCSRTRTIARTRTKNGSIVHWVPNMFKLGLIGLRFSSPCFIVLARQSTFYGLRLVPMRRSSSLALRHHRFSLCSNTPQWHWRDLAWLSSRFSATSVCLPWPRGVGARLRVGMTPWLKNEGGGRVVCTDGAMEGVKLWKAES